MKYTSSISSLSADEFKTIQTIVHESIGVNLTEAKNALVVSRLSKRLRELDLKSFADYICFLEDDPDEIHLMFNYLTTNVTKFFREEHHFDYLNDVYLPEFEATNRNSQHTKKIRIWSAGCSTGEEPYTLAIVLSNYMKNKKNIDFEILASDVNTEVLDKAKKGIYTRKEVEGIPYNFLKEYFKLGDGSNRGFFKAKESLQNKISFRRRNLAAVEDYPTNEPLDILFCRNVFIYFDNETRSKVLSHFYRCLKPGGLLFVGHSESVKPTVDNNGSWSLIRHTIYERLSAERVC